jgi:hypothetical protein
VAIGDAIVRALTDDDHRAVLLAAGRRAVERWTWSSVATSTIDALATMTPRWSQRPRRPALRIAVAGVFGAGHDGATSTAAIAATNEQLVEALRSTGTDAIALVDNAGLPEPSRAGADRWPVRALGRFVKPWDLDHIVAVLGAAPQHVATSAMARTVPCHLWIHDDALIGVRFGANLQALEIARSVIVASDAAAELVRGAADRACPILVVATDAEFGVDPMALASALVEWLAGVDDLDPSTIRRHEPPVASSDS